MSGNVLPTATHFVDVAAENRFAIGMAMRCTVDDIAIAVFNVDGCVYALEDFCLRCGSSLAAGAVSGVVVTCMDCHWRYDAASGCVRGVSSLRVDTFKAEIVDSRIMIASTANPIPGVTAPPSSTRSRRSRIS